MYCKIVNNVDLENMFVKWMFIYVFIIIILFIYICKFNMIFFFSFNWLVRRGVWIDGEIYSFRIIRIFYRKCFYIDKDMINGYYFKVYLYKSNETIYLI